MTQGAYSQARPQVRQTICTRRTYLVQEKIKTKTTSLILACNICIHARFLYAYGYNVFIHKEVHAYIPCIYLYIYTYIHTHTIEHMFIYKYYVCLVCAYITMKVLSICTNECVSFTQQWVKACVCCIMKCALHLIDIDKE